MKSKYVRRLGIFVAASLFAVGVSTTVPAVAEPGEETAWESEVSETEAVVLSTSPGETREDEPAEVSDAGSGEAMTSSNENETAGEAGAENEGRAVSGPVRLIGSAGEAEDPEAVYSDELVVRSTDVTPPDDGEAVQPSEESAPVEFELPIKDADIAEAVRPYEGDEAAEAAALTGRESVGRIIPGTSYAQSGPTVLVGDAGTSVTRKPTPTAAASAEGVSTRTAGGSGSQTGSGTESSGSSAGSSGSGSAAGGAGTTSAQGAESAVPVRTSKAVTRTELPKTGDFSTPLFHIGMMSCSLTALIDQSFKFRQRRKR